MSDPTPEPDKRNGHSPFDDRKDPPRSALGYDSKPGRPLEFRVWVHHPTYIEDDLPWKCVAAFAFLQEALSYIAALQDNKVACVFQSPADCRQVLPTDMRVVYEERE